MSLPEPAMPLELDPLVACPPAPPLPLLLLVVKPVLVVAAQACISASAEPNDTRGITNERKEGCFFTVGSWWGESEVTPKTAAWERRATCILDGTQAPPGVGFAERPYGVRHRRALRSTLAAFFALFTDTGAS
jgi:hypothetical protein